MRVTLLLAFSVLFVLATVGPVKLEAQSTRGHVFIVNDVGDSNDVDPGDSRCADAFGKCTLRAAIDESNATPQRDLIIFDVPVPAVINLTLGELAVTNELRILGRGARRLTIQRATPDSLATFRIFNLQAIAEIRGLTIKNGNTATDGGGILINSIVHLYDVAVTGNRAANGGGISFEPDGQGNIERCLINSNVADHAGGIYISAGHDRTVRNTTITANSATTSGAIENNGIRNFFANDTISGNSSTQGPSCIMNAAGGAFYVINSILGYDLGQTVPTLQGAFGSRGYNIVPNSTGSSGWTVGDQVSTNNQIDPMLGPLGNNGGRVDTMALLPGSPAIDHADDCVAAWACLGYEHFEIAFDARQLSRGVHNLDIGAFELGAVAIVGAWNGPAFFGQSQRLAFAPVTIINTETMERRYSHIFLQDIRQGLRGGTAPMLFDYNTVYVGDLTTKRTITDDLEVPLVIEFTQWY